MSLFSILKTCHNSLQINKDENYFFKSRAKKPDGQTNIDEYK